MVGGRGSRRVPCVGGEVLGALFQLLSLGGSALVGIGGYHEGYNPQGFQRYIHLK